MILQKYLDQNLYPGYSFLTNKFPYFISQLKNDKELSIDLKYDCLDNICSTPIKTESDLKDKCNSFFDSKKLIGSICKNSENKNSYIRINGKDSLVSWVSQISGLPILNINSLISTILYSSNTVLRNGFMNKMLSIEAINDSYILPENSLKYFGVKKWKSKTRPTLKDAFLTNFNYIQWSFPDSKTEDLFKDQATIDIMPCRAGIAFSEEKLIFTHNLNDSYNVRKPTVFDARLYPQFQPGGSTKPLAQCNHLSGFVEYVHIPNNFQNIDNFKAETFYKI